MARWSSRCTTTAASSVGARLNLPPGASMRSSASKISASSELGRCWVIRPHMASLVSSAAMTDPARNPLADPQLDAVLDAQGPIDAGVAQRLIQRGRERLGLGDAPAAVIDFRRAIGHDDPNITGPAMLGYGDALYRLDDERQATAAWEAVTRFRENPATYQAWRNLAGARVRAGELQPAIEAYPTPGRRAPAHHQAASGSRLGW